MKKYPFKRPIFISLSPNTQKDDVFLALKLLFQPWCWKKEKAVFLLEEKFKEYLGVKYAFSFNSGRSAILAILSCLDLAEKNEVLIQAFTCNALVNPILHLKLKPVFIDVEEGTFNIDLTDLKNKITSESKVVIVQHTFGLPVKIKEILEICQKNGSTGASIEQFSPEFTAEGLSRTSSPQDNLVLIEDCAHSLGASYKNRKVGTFGKAAFFSFGRDKIISSVYGGVAITDDPILGEKLRKFQEKCSQPSYFWIFQQLLYPILIEYLIKPLYKFFGVGKWFLFFFQKLKILSRAVTKKEKQGRLPPNFPQKLPNALAILALNQFKKLEKFNEHRKKIAEIYNRELKDLKIQLPFQQEGRIYMRYSLILEGRNTDQILEEMKKSKIYLDDGWRKTAVVPPDTDQNKMGYNLGSCPKAEKVAEFILNLPTHINIKETEAEEIAKKLNEFLV